MLKPVCKLAMAFVILLVAFVFGASVALLLSVAALAGAVYSLYLAIRDVRHGDYFLAVLWALMFICGGLIASYARAHDAGPGWSYDAYCCNGNSHTGDCQKIPTERVRITPNGYVVEIRPGDHRLVTVHHRFEIKQSDARQSRDEFYHLCLYPDEYTPRCFYAPDMGS